MVTAMNDTDLTDARTLIAAIQGTLGTDETGANLVSVCRAAHEAELREAQRERQANEQGADLTDAQVLRWLQDRAECLAIELNEPKLALHTHHYAEDHGAPCITLNPRLADNYRGRTIEEVVASYRGRNSKEALRSLALFHRAEADRLEREAAQ